MPSSASSRRPVACDFYRVNLGSKNDLTFIQVMDHIHKTHPSPQRRNLSTDEGYIRVHEWRTNGKNAEGVLLRLRATHSASIARIDQDELRDLSLAPGEVLAEYFCFRYVDEYKTLVVHRNRDAGGCSRLSTYLEKMMPECRPIEFEMILTEDAWKKLERMYRYTVAEVTIAKPTSLAVFDSGNESVNRMAKISADTDAELLTLRLSVGHPKRSLSNVIKQIMAVVTGSGIAQQAKVSGYETREITTGMFKDELTEVDLITDRLRAKVSIVVSGGRAQTSDYQRALAEAYSQHRDEIKKQFDQARAAP